MSDIPENSRVEEVRIGSTFGATVPIQVKKVKCNALVDTGVTKSCISREFHEILQSPPLKTIQRSKVISANGSTINVLGITTCPITIGKKSFNVDFLVCDNIRRPCYIGLDFLRKNKVGIGWSPGGKFELQVRNQPLIESVDTHIMGPKIYPRHDTQVPPRSLMILNVHMDLSQAMPGLIYDVMPNVLLKETHPNLVTIPMLHNVEGHEVSCVPYIIVNLSQEGIFL